MTPLIPIGGSVVLNALAQISLRYGTSLQVPRKSSPPNPWIILWALGFCAATLLWLIAIRRSDISYAYPLLGAGYAMVTLLARWLLKERISPMRWLSILVISAGVFMVGVNQ